MSEKTIALDGILFSLEVWRDLGDGETYVTTDAKPITTDPKQDYWRSIGVKLIYENN